MKKRKISSVWSFEQGITTRRIGLGSLLIYSKMVSTLTKIVLQSVLIQQLPKSESLRKWEQ